MGRFGATTCVTNGLLAAFGSLAAFSSFFVSFFTGFSGAGAGFTLFGAGTGLAAGADLVSVFFAGVGAFATGLATAFAGAAFSADLPAAFLGAGLAGEAFLATGFTGFFAALGAGFAATFPLGRDEDVFTGALAAFFGAAFFAAGLAAGFEAFFGAAFGAGFAAFFAGFLAMTIPVLKNVRKYSRPPASIGRPH
jgi:hypothetical protein